MSSNSSPRIRHTAPMVRVEGRVSGSAAMGSVLDERESVLADLQLVSVRQASVLDALAVHVGAVQAALVEDVDAVRALLEHGVLTRDGDVVQKHIRLRGAADGGARRADRELVARAATAQPDHQA